jgi:hypothetical protein
VLECYLEADKQFILYQHLLQLEQKLEEELVMEEEVKN